MKLRCRTQVDDKVFPKDFQNEFLETVLSIQKFIIDINTVYKQSGIVYNFSAVFHHFRRCFAIYSNSRHLSPEGLRRLALRTFNSESRNRHQLESANFVWICANQADHLPKLIQNKVIFNEIGFGNRFALDQARTEAWTQLPRRLVTKRCHTVRRQESTGTINQYSVISGNETAEVITARKRYVFK